MKPLKIAYLSFEFPPDTGIGGIATYTLHSARLMAARGHQVEVFAASRDYELLDEDFEHNITVHRLHCNEREHFSGIVCTHFLHRHYAVGFDIVESPEFMFEGYAIHKKLPALPMVIRFHTPKFWIRELNHSYLKNNYKERLKKMLDIRQYNKEDDREYLFAADCNNWSCPSQAMKTVLQHNWHPGKAKLTVIPNPYLPSEILLTTAAATHTDTITYIGRLEVRKGMVPLTEAIRIVLNNKTGVHFRLIGKSEYGPDHTEMMMDYMQRELKEFSSVIEFIPHLEPSLLETCFAKTDICVFPSLWEAFGYTCIEAMAAARGIVAGNIGGMKEMLEDINPGALVDPHNPQQIAEALLVQLNNPDERIANGLRYREKVMHYYREQVIVEMENYYREVIQPHPYCSSTSGKQ